MMLTIQDTVGDSVAAGAVADNYDGAAAGPSSFPNQGACSDGLAVLSLAVLRHW